MSSYLHFGTLPDVDTAYLIVPALSDEMIVGILESRNWVGAALIPATIRDAGKLTLLFRVSGLW